MRLGQLRDQFVGAGAKRLSAVDAEPKRSNQHEVGTTREMRERFLGEGDERFRVVYVLLGRDENVIRAHGYATHYDARKNQFHRAAEWRLYYPANPVTEAMREGDTLFLAMDRKRVLYFVVATTGSTGENQLSWLFGLYPTSRSFETRDLSEHERKLDISARRVLDEIGIEFEDPDADQLDAYIDQYDSFPATVEFSEVARRSLPKVRAEDDPDSALVAWVTREEALFRRLEGRLVASRIEQGFVGENGPDVDGFLKYSLRVRQRRFSRAGRALENHLEAVFDALDIAYDRDKKTELNHRPDFLFPSASAYHTAPATGATWLTMLGAKSTCKDRWRQVLVEAAKIPRKHLLTLEPGISNSQTNQMEESDLQLVVPQPVHETYEDDEQRTWLWTLSDFILEVQDRARRAGSSPR